MPADQSGARTLSSTKQETVAVSQSPVVTAISATTIVQVLSSLIALGVPVLAPAIAADLGMDPKLIGYYPGILYSAALAICIIGDPLLSLVRPMLRSLVCVLISIVGLALLLGASLPFFILGALMIGLGYGPIVPSTSQILSARTPGKHANLIFSLKQSGAPLGGILAGIIMPFLVGYAGGWKGAIEVVAVGGVLVLLALSPLTPRLDKGVTPLRSAGMLAPIKAVLAVPSLRQLVIMSSSYGGMQLCLGAFLTVYLVHVLNLDFGLAGLVFGVSQAAGMIGRLVWGYVADRFFTPKTLMAFLGFAMAASAFLVAAFSAEWPFWAILVVSAAYGGTAMGWNGVLLAEVARIAPPGETGRVTSGVMSANYAGVIVGPLLFTAIAYVMSTQRAGFILIGIITALSACTSFRVRTSRDEAEIQGSTKF